VDQRQVQVNVVGLVLMLKPFIEEDCHLGPPLAAPEGSARNCPAADAVDHAGCRTAAAQVGELLCSPCASATGEIAFQVSWVVASERVRGYLELRVFAGIKPGPGFILGDKELAVHARRVAGGPKDQPNGSPFLNSLVQH